MSDESTRFREPSDAERRLLRRLASSCSDCPPDWLQDIRVSQMDDGRMGSLRLAVRGAPVGERVFGRKAAEYQFSDTDGIQVIASLNVDQHGLPFELDVWKTDFSPLVRIPDGLDAE